MENHEDCTYHKGTPADLVCYICRKPICDDDSKRYKAKSWVHKYSYSCCIPCYYDQQQKKLQNFLIGFFIAIFVVVPFLTVTLVLDPSFTVSLQNIIILGVFIIFIPVYLSRLFFRIRNEVKMSKNAVSLFKQSLQKA